jgi:hypothetical protein
MKRSGSSLFSYVLHLLLLWLFLPGRLFASEYVAFSLKVAERKIMSDRNWRSSEVFDLGGLTAIKGLVIDRETGDIILVGEKDPNRAPLTLDDFVVALRARFIYNQWPVVSIDPNEETEKTGMQTVRYEGGIQETQFGEDLYVADYNLKRIGIGFSPTGVENVPSYWDLSTETSGASPGRTRKISSRFWFYPVLPSVAVRENVVAIKGLKIGVFTEVLSAEVDEKKFEDLSTFRDTVGDKFAAAISNNFDMLAKIHPSFLRLQGLVELVALTKALEDMDDQVDLSFYLRDYHVERVATEKVVEVLRRNQERELQTEGGTFRGYYELSGGVELMAIALRVKAGDVTALREAVLRTRPQPDALSWGFVVGEWLIPTSIVDGMDSYSVAAFYSHGEFLFRQRDYDRAIAVWLEVARAYPDMSETYSRIGAAYDRKVLPALAAEYYTKALELEPFRRNVQQTESERQP